MKKTALITGASRGIGRAAAHAFAKAGYNVAVNYLHSKEAADCLVNELRSSGADAAAFMADVSSHAEAGLLINDVSDRFSRIDVLVNNAGTAYSRLLQQTPPEAWRRIFAVNTDSVYNCCFHALPHMISEKRGSIINIASMWGVTGASMEVAYSASKAAVTGFTKALAKEVGPSGIRVNCIAPGVISTDMNALLSDADKAALADEAPLCRIGSADEVAGAIVFLASDSASFITGQVLGVDGGFAI